MLALSLMFFAALVFGGHVEKRLKTCTVHPSGNFTDDSPAIIDAFNLCGQGGKVLQTNYNIYGDLRTGLDRVSERDLLDRESDEYDWAE
jgi:hypothetical protein